MNDSAPMNKAVGTPPARTPRKRGHRPAASILAQGEPCLWLTGGALALAVVMILGLLGLVLYFGGSTFWPGHVLRLEVDGSQPVMGEVFRDDYYRPREELITALSPGARVRAKAMLAKTDGAAHRRLIRTANYDITGTHFTWISDYEVATPAFVGIEHDGEVWIMRAGSPDHKIHDASGALPEHYVKRMIPKSEITIRVADDQTWDDFRKDTSGEMRPLWALTIERMSWGRFFGFPAAFRVSGEVAADSHDAAWAMYEEHHDAVRALWRQRRELEVHAIGRVNRQLESARLRLRQAQIREKPPIAWVSAYGDLKEVRRGGTPEEIANAEAALREVERATGKPNERYIQAVTRFEEENAKGNERFGEIMGRIADLNRRMAAYELVLETVTGETKIIPLAEIVRAYPANQLGLGGKIRIYLARWWEFLADEPREANMEGGVMPAIFGTVTMTMLMSVAVVPFGVLAALYLREYAKAGPMISAVRIAINNLAGVPSIVFGVFGLGFFCYIIGAGIDQLFYETKLPNPTFGKGGLIWASLTLALLTLPVVIVATEEALAAVPRSMREGSYACGASKWQTIRRIVLPRAMPGIMTGAILAMARGAGEVAPLMLVGAVKLAPELPIDGIPPFIHMHRSFMHLGFHIYDLGFQSQNSEAAKPMVFTTTLLLIAIIALLNCAAIWLRSRLRRRFITSQF